MSPEGFRCCSAAGYGLWCGGRRPCPQVVVTMGPRCLVGRGGLVLRRTGWENEPPSCFCSHCCFSRSRGLAHFTRNILLGGKSSSTSCAVLVNARHRRSPFLDKSRESLGDEISLTSARPILMQPAWACVPRVTSSTIARPSGRPFGNNYA